MPTGTPYHSFIPPYDIRVDDFTDSAGLTTVPALHLLTHTHSDHITGLSAKSFASTVICSRDAKQMLLRHEVYSERALYETEVRAEKVRTYHHLRVAPKTMEDGTVNHVGSRDLLHDIALRIPKPFQLSNNRSVTITAFDANHCPGAVMYLVEGGQGAVLHTGDFRAEPWFLDSIRREPLLQKYLAVPDFRQTHSSSAPVSETLEAIYLDTACLLGNGDLPSKTQATADLVSLMALFPESTYFFINSWTWGYEDVLKEVARAFQNKIHVDRYKHSIYQKVSDPFMQHIVTEDDKELTRFHACERFDRCKHVKVDGRASHTSSGNHVVYVNPVTMGMTKWTEYVEDTRAQLERGEEVHNLLVPLSRHSSLPELRQFVSLFKPRRVVPNTLDPTLAGLDCACLPAMFAGCVSSEDDMRTECTDICASIPSYSNFSILTQAIDSGKDVTLQNLEGEGAQDVAQRWIDSGRPRRKLETLRQYLPDHLKQFVELVLAGDRESAESLQSQIQAEARSHRSQASGSALVTEERPAQGRATSSQTKRAMARLAVPNVVPAGFFSDEDSVDEEDAHLRTAEILFLSPGSRPVQYPSSSPVRYPNNSQQASPPVIGATKKASQKPLGLPLTPGSSQRPDLPNAAEVEPPAPITVLSAFPGCGEVLQVPLTPRRHEVALPSPKTSNQRYENSASVSIWREEVASIQALDLKKKQKSTASRGMPLSELRGSANTEPLHGVPENPNTMSSSSLPHASIAKRPRGGTDELEDAHNPSPTLKRPRFADTKNDHREDYARPTTSDIDQSGLLADPERIAETPSKAERERRRKVRFEALLAAEKFLQDHPERAEADREWTEQVRQKASRARRGLIPAEKSLNQDRTHDNARPRGIHELDDSEIVVEDGMQMDMERIEQLVASFKAGFARGLRPGLVIPRLRASTCPPDNVASRS